MLAAGECTRPERVVKSAVVVILLLLLAASLKAENGYVEPLVECHEYTDAAGNEKVLYAVLTLETDSSGSPVVTDPCEAEGKGPILKKTVVDETAGAGCVSVDGALGEDYTIAPYPVCSTSAGGLTTQTKDVLGIFGCQKKEEVAPGSKCPGEITKIDHHVDSSSAVQSLTITVNFINNGGNDCCYRACTPLNSLFNAGGSGACGDWVTLSPGMTGSDVIETSTAYAFTNGNFDVILHSSEQCLGLWSYFTFLPGIDTQGAEVDKKENAACQDGAAQLCQGTNDIGEATYGTVESSKYAVLTNKYETGASAGAGSAGDLSALLSAGGEKTVWLLPLDEYLPLDMSTCTSSGTQKTFYTVVKYATYYAMIEEKFASDPAYKRYAEVYGKDHANLLYCYKTELANTSGCREINEKWYDLSAENDQNSITSDLLEDVKTWNRNQPVDELVSLDRGVSSRFKPLYAPPYCTVSMDRDYYTPGSNITIYYSNLPEEEYILSADKIEADNLQPPNKAPNTVTHALFSKGPAPPAPEVYETKDGDFVVTYGDYGTYHMIVENGYLNVYNSSLLKLYGAGGGKKRSVEWAVGGTGNRTYNLSMNDPGGTWTASLGRKASTYYDKCDVADSARTGSVDAKAGSGEKTYAVSNVMSRIFAVTPLLEDGRTGMLWTRTGEGTVYAGGGMERYDVCELSCNAATDSNLLESCEPWMGSSSLECTCESDREAGAGPPQKPDPQACKKASPSCDDKKQYDCGKSACKIVSRPFALEAPVGGDYYGIPYKGNCPDGGFERKDVDKYTHLWVDKDASAAAVKEPRCVLEGGVIGITTYSFPPKASDAQIVFVVDTSDSMKDEWATICGTIKDVIGRLGEQDAKIEYTIYGLAGKDKTSTWETTGVKLDTIPNCMDAEVAPHIKRLGCSEIKEGLKDSSTDLTALDCEKSSDCRMESWGPAVEYVIKKHLWKDNYKRIVFAISDEDAQCGDNTADSDGNGDAQVEGALKAADESSKAGNDVGIYGIYGEKSDIASQMAKITANQPGHTLEFLLGPANEKKNADAVTNMLIEAVTEDQVVEVSDVEVKAVPVEPDAAGESSTWVIEQQETKTESGGGEWFGGRFVTWVKGLIGSKPIELATSYNVTDSGNMPFKITYANLRKDDEGRYVLTRVYKPHDPARKLVISSKTAMNYTLADSSPAFRVAVNHTYVTQVRRDIYYTTCRYGPWCECSDKAAEYNWELLSSACGGEGGRYACEDGAAKLTQKRTEKETELITSVASEKEILKAGGIVRDNLVCEKDNLKGLTIEGTIDERVDEVGDVIPYCSLDNPIIVTVPRDILTGFSFRVSSSYIDYRGMVFPVVHTLSRKASSPGPDATWSDVTDSYGSRDPAFGFPPQCRKTCPVGQCSCNPETPLEPQCTGETPFRWDCACRALGCYPNPCVSYRSYHESDGGKIQNGNFEAQTSTSGEIPAWKKEGSAQTDFFGLTGKLVEFSGAIEQDFLPSADGQPTHSSPYNLLCLDYGIKSDLDKVKDKGGKLALYVTMDGMDEEYTEYEYTLWEYADYFRGPGWNRACVPVEGNISRIRLETKPADLEVAVDNVNLGGFYDYVGIQTLETANISYMDTVTSNYESSGLLKTVFGVFHEKNVYYFDFETVPMANLNAVRGKTPSVPGMEALNSLLGTVGAGGEKDCGSNSLNKDDIMKGSITIKTFFKDVSIPLKNAETDCYTVNLIYRKASQLQLIETPEASLDKAIDVTSIKRLSVPAGSQVVATVKYTEYAKTLGLVNKILPDEKVYLEAVGGNIWEEDPVGLSKAYIFDYDEIKTDPEQQKTVLEAMAALIKPLAKSLEGATVSSDGTSVTVTSSDGKTPLATVKCQEISKGGECNVTTADYNVRLGIRGPAPDETNKVYESEKMMQTGYVKTDPKGEAVLRFSPKSSIYKVYTFASETHSPTSMTFGLHVISIKSPLLSPEFLLLVLIFLFAVFSYRYFKDKRIDFYSWWRDYTGKK